MPVAYEISLIMPSGFEGRKITDGVWGSVAIGRFDTLAEAEAFAHRMYAIDAEAVPARALVQFGGLPILPAVW